MRFSLGCPQRKEHEAALAMPAARAPRLAADARAVVLVRHLFGPVSSGATYRQECLSSPPALAQASRSHAPNEGHRKPLRIHALDHSVSVIIYLTTSHLTCSAPRLSRFIPLVRDEKMWQRLYDEVLDFPSGTLKTYCTRGCESVLRARSAPLMDTFPRPAKGAASSCSQP